MLQLSCLLIATIAIKIASCHDNHEIVKETNLIKRMLYDGQTSTSTTEEPFEISAEKYRDKYYRDLQTGNKAKAKKNKKMWLALRDDNIAEIEAIKEGYSNAYTKVMWDHAHHQGAYYDANQKHQQWQGLASALYNDGPFDPIKKPHLNPKEYKYWTSDQLDNWRGHLMYEQAEKEAKQLSPGQLGNLHFSLMKSESRIAKLLSKIEEKGYNEDLQGKLDRARYKHSLRKDALLKRKWKGASQLAKMYEASRDRHYAAKGPLYEQQQKLESRYETWKNKLKEVQNQPPRQPTAEDNFYTHFYASDRTTPVDSPYHSDSD